MSRRGLGYISSSGTGTVVSAGVLYGVATGGSSSSITISGVNYTLLTYLSDANLVVTSPGIFDVLLVGAGGGSTGGGENGSVSGGGGAGQVVGINDLTSLYLAAGTYAVDIGAGRNNTGNGSAIGTMISAAGGGRSSATGYGPRQSFETAGGSGGGHAQATSFVVGVFGGNVGEGSSTYTNGGAGGGGAGGVGVVNSGVNGGAGGAGVQVNTWIGGSSYFVGGGGGGGAYSGTGGAGGSGGGGAGGANNSVSGTVGTANTGGGAGGGGGAQAGGSGVVYVRFKI